MLKTFFHKVNEETETRFWINNPTYKIAKEAIEEGAINCTTNPAYSSKLINSDLSDELMDAVKRAAKSTDNNSDAVDRVQFEIVTKLADVFAELHEENPNRCGFVSLQGNPHKDTDANNIIEEAVRYAASRKNIIPKIPTTKAGIEAIEVLVEKNLPIIATEIMSVGQTKNICEVYMKMAKKSGNTPPLFITHITGIFDEFLTNEAEANDIEISDELLKNAGTIVAQKQYNLMKENGYPGIMLGGGARDLYHFTNFIGWEMDITINWSTAQTLIEQDNPVMKMNLVFEQEKIDELSEKLPTFKKAYYENEMTVEEYEEYGPVCYFRDSFIRGWDIIADLVKQARA